MAKNKIKILKNSNYESSVTEYCNFIFDQNFDILFY